MELEDQPTNSNQDTSVPSDSAPMSITQRLEKDLIKDVAGLRAEGSKLGHKSKDAESTLRG